MRVRLQAAPPLWHNIRRYAQACLVGHAYNALERASDEDCESAAASSFGIVAKKLALHQMRSALEPKVVSR